MEFAEPDDVRRVVAEHGDAGTEGLLQAVNEHRKVLKGKTPRLKLYYAVAADFVVGIVCCFLVLAVVLVVVLVV